MRWPWGGSENRQESSYTDALIATLVAQASGQTLAQPTATAALEAAAGAVGRAFASAEPKGPTELTSALSASVLRMIGRELIRTGEAVFHLRVIKDRMLALPCADWDVSGSSPDPNTWTYRLSVSAPDNFVTVPEASADEVLHFRYQSSPSSPWRGISPLEAAAQSGRLSAELTKLLADEAAGPRGALLPVPKPGDDPTLAPLKAALKNLNGSLALVESMTSGWSGSDVSPAFDWKPVRLGMAIPQSIVELQPIITSEIHSACGCSGLFSIDDASGKRESYRQFLHGTIMPLSNQISEELALKFDSAVVLNFDSLMASDLSGRARAFSQMVTGGLSLEKAASLSGLMAQD